MESGLVGMWAGVEVGVACWTQGWFPLTLGSGPLLGLGRGSAKGHHKDGGEVGYRVRVRAQVRIRVRVSRTGAACFGCFGATREPTLALRSLVLPEPPLSQPALSLLPIVLHSLMLRSLALPQPPLSQPALALRPQYWTCAESHAPCTCMRPSLHVPSRT